MEANLGQIQNLRAALRGPEKLSPRSYTASPRRRTRTAPCEDSRRRFVVLISGWSVNKGLECRRKLQAGKCQRFNPRVSRLAGSTAFRFYTAVGVVFTELMTAEVAVVSTTVSRRVDSGF